MKFAKISGIEIDNQEFGLNQVFPDLKKRGIDNTASNCEDLFSCVCASLAITLLYMIYF